MTATSLRRRILLLTLAVAGVVLMLFAIPLVVLLQQATRENSIDRATDLVHGVADYVSSSPVDDQTLTDYVQRVNDRQDDFTVGVLLPDGSWVGASPVGIELGGHASGFDPDHDHDQGGFEETSQTIVRSVSDGQLVSVQVAGQQGPVTVWSLVSTDHVRDAFYQRLAVVGVAALVALGLAALGAELVSRQLVRKLAATADTADRLGDGDFTVRAPEDGPEEVRRVAIALNRLAGRIDQLLLLERETVADLSHRLRTPLTAVRLDVDALPLGPARSELESRLDLLQRTLTAVIHAARRPEREGAIPHCDAAVVAAARVDFWRPLIDEQGRPLTVELAAPPLPVRCAESELAAAIDALLENVLAHTPEGTALGVVLRSDSRDVVLEVRDRGPGIPERALHRGRSDRGSSGLGLDIASRCAESSGGEIALLRDEDTTVVVMRLGAA